MIKQNTIKINLEFGLIVAMALLILSYTFYIQNYEAIQTITQNIVYGFFRGFEILMRVLIISFTIVWIIKLLKLF